jgi:glycine hydroxymethyltransferase
MERGMTICTGGTDNHLLLWDLRPLGITGGKAERVMEYCGITVNKNTLVGDKSAVRVGGVRIGVCALTSRGMKEVEMGKVADFMVKAVKMGVEIEGHMGEGGKKVVKVSEFARVLGENEGIDNLCKEVEEFAGAFFMPGEDLAW